MSRIRVTVNVSSVIATAIADLAAKRETTMTNAIEQAITDELFIDDLQHNGNTILVEDKHGDRRRLVPR